MHISTRTWYTEVLNKCLLKLLYRVGILSLTFVSSSLRPHGW